MWILAIYAEKTEQVRNQNLDDVWLCHEIHDECQSVFGQKNNEVARGLASDVLCTLHHMSMIVTCDTCKNKDETDESD